MITVGLMGRLGNNLFQMAAALGLSSRLGVSCSYTNNQSYLNAFDLPDISPIGKQAPNIFKERKFNFNESFSSLNDNTHLSGYFQSEKYFKYSEDLVRKNFAFKSFVRDNTTANGFGYLEDPTNNYTALHVRRTDYMGIQHAHPLCTMTYYNECVNRLTNTDKILIFSDDPQWCRTIFCDSKYQVVDLDLHCSMYAMTKVKNIIAANSTFSWWGAWLNNRKDKTVYCPAKWFGDTLPYRTADIDISTCLQDLFPPNWNVL